MHCLLRSIHFVLLGSCFLNLPLAQADVHIQGLAATCAACHGTNGNAVNGMASLAGLNANYFETQMLAFKTGSRPATVMHRHAAGLTTNEINALADYFAGQVASAPVKLIPQTLQLK